MSLLLKRLPIFGVLAIAFLMISCGEEKKEEQKEDQSAALNEWFDTKYEEVLQKSPLQLTMLGRKDKYDQLDDMSLEAEQEMREWYEASVAELEEKFDYEALEMDDKISYDLWVYQYDMMKEGEAFKNMNYVFHQMNGIHTQLPSFMINFHKVDSLSDMKAYISRIEASDRAMNQLLDRAKQQAEKGILPPKFAFETVLKQSKALVEGQPFTETGEETALWSDMNMKIGTLLEKGDIDETEADSLKAHSKKALTEHFKPAYDNLISWVETEMPNAEATPTGVSRHPDGEAFYNYRLKASTTTDLTADEVHNIGLS
ncbi:MAG: DUF885 domain-containing protein, partial [Flavobacteriaceae bacterium]